MWSLVTLVSRIDSELVHRDLVNSSQTVVNWTAVGVNVTWQAHDFSVSAKTGLVNYTWDSCLHTFWAYWKVSKGLKIFFSAWVTTRIVLIFKPRSDLRSTDLVVIYANGLFCKCNVVISRATQAIVAHTHVCTIGYACAVCGYFVLVDHLTPLLASF